MIFTFAGTIANWITDDWELVEQVIDFHVIEDKEHEGQFAAKGFAKALSEMGILEKMSWRVSKAVHIWTNYLIIVYLIALTLDNAATNDVLLRTLSNLLIQKFGIQFVVDNSQIRCLAHVVNLVVQKILAALEEADDPDVFDYYEVMKDIPIHYNINEDKELKVLENEEYEPEDEADDPENSSEELFDKEEIEKDANSSPLKKVRHSTSFSHKHFFISFTSSEPLSRKYQARLNVANNSAS